MMFFFFYSYRKTVLYLSTSFSITVEKENDAYRVVFPL